MVERTDGSTVDLGTWKQRIINSSMGFFFLSLEWFLRVGARVGSGREGVPASSRRIWISGRLRALERSVARLARMVSR
jgi:hypothetical protein